jgi:hypothetical protein
MKPLKVISVFFLLGAMYFAANASPAHAATICSYNAGSGQFEGRIAPDGVLLNGCSLKGTRSQPMDVLVAINSGGAKLVIGSGVEIPKQSNNAADQTAQVQTSTVLTPTLQPKTGPGYKWVIKTTHRSIRDVLEDWAAAVDYEVVWETRDFPLELKKDKVISTGDFWDALTTIGETYADSDAPFQILPTKFNQIVVLPRRQQTEIKNGGVK